MIIVCTISHMVVLIRPSSDSTPHIISPTVDPPVMLSLTPHTLILAPPFTPASSMLHTARTSLSGILSKQGAD